MPTFYSPAGNPEVWEKKPDGYYTVDEWQALHPSPASTPPTSEELFATLRSTRDLRLAVMDKYLLSDYPITADALAQVKAYRAALRNLPDQPGAPWPDGDIPWPIKPNV